MSGATASAFGIAPNKDVPIGIDIFHCQGCPQTWTNANSAVKYATVATVGAYTAAPLLGEAGTTAAGDALFNAYPRGLLKWGRLVWQLDSDWMGRCGTVYSRWVSCWWRDLSN